MNEVTVDAVGETSIISGAFRSLRWLADSLKKYGLRLSQGQVILTGSAMKLHPVAAGSTIVVDAGPLGQSCALISP